MILPLEKQVCSLELAKKLKELGVPQDTIFAYTPCEICAKDDKEHYHIDLNDGVSYEVRDLIAAYTIAELKAMVPANHDFYINDLAKILIIYLEKNEYTIDDITQQIAQTKEN